MNQKAFTLVEIIIVGMILGILAMMILPDWVKTMNRSYAEDALHNLIAIYAGEQNYSQTHGGNYFTGSGITAINSGLDLAISAGNITYNCDAATMLCTAVGSATNGNFTMQVSLDPANSPINSPVTPVYCDGNHNPCCSTAGGGTAGLNCP